MQQVTLSALQSVMILILNELKKPMTGYDLKKVLGERGYKWSHQQIYRDLAKLPLNLKHQPQEGKPDRKLYSPKSDVEYNHNAKVMPVPVIEEYELLDVAIEKRGLLLSQHSKLTLNYEREFVQFEIDYLEKLIVKLQKKAA